MLEEQEAEQRRRNADAMTRFMNASNSSSTRPPGQLLPLQSPALRSPFQNQTQAMPGGRSGLSRRLKR